MDTELAKLPGVYKSKELDTVLEDLVKREAEIGVPNEESAGVFSLYNKNKTQNGLSMQDGNEAKRLYERNVKLGYQKENNTIGITRATRLDTALRNWQLKTAKKLGLTNLDDLNKQTQLSKFIVNKLGKQLTGKTGNDAISLTDWVILSGGDPTAITAFFLKKGLLNKGFQSSIAKMISKKSPTEAIKAKFGGKTGLPAKLPNIDYGTTIEMGGRKPPTTFEPQSQNIRRSSSLPEQKLLPAGGKSQGIPIRLPKSIRETNLGLDEVKNTVNLRNSQTTQKETPLQVLLPKESKKAYSESLPQVLKGSKRGLSTTSKDLEPLATEARKYKSAEEFVKGVQGKTIDLPTDFVNQFVRSRGGRSIGENISSLEKGFDRKKPIDLVINGDGTASLGDGNGRALAAKQLGMKEVPVRITVNNNFSLKDFPESKPLSLTDFYNKAVGKKTSNPLLPKRKTGGNKR